MTEETKRAMTIKQESFNPYNHLQSNPDVFELFYSKFYDALQPHESSRVQIIEHPEILFRVAATNEGAPLQVRLERGSGRKVYHVNYPKFAKDALSEIENYRLIYERNVDGIYVAEEVKNFRPGTGIYVLAHDDEPWIRVEVSDTQGFIAGPMSFTGVRGNEVFTYSPELKGARKVSFKTEVPKRAIGLSEGLLKKVFLDVHEELVNRYTSE